MNRTMRVNDRAPLIALGASFSRQQITQLCFKEPLYKSSPRMRDPAPADPLCDTYQRILRLRAITKAILCKPASCQTQTTTSTASPPCQGDVPSMKTAPAFLPLWRKPMIASPSSRMAWAAIAADVRPRIWPFGNLSPATGRFGNAGYAQRRPGGTGGSQPSHPYPRQQRPEHGTDGHHIHCPDPALAHKRRSCTSAIPAPTACVPVDWNN